MGFKNPGFQDRIGAAAEARQKALDKLRAKPPLDEAKVAEQIKRQAEREAREAEKVAAKKAAKEAEAAAKAEAIAQAEAARKAAMPKLPTAEELKARRDARYAARKARK